VADQGHARLFSLRVAMRLSEGWQHVSRCQPLQ
jgi:hypothetical protein